MIQGCHHRVSRLANQMKEQRRHQRIRFGVPPLVRLGQSGLTGIGRLENLSFGGLMVRTALPLRVGEAFGCEFAVFGEALIDMSAIVVGQRIGDAYCARFQAGPISQHLIEDVIPARWRPARLPF